MSELRPCPNLWCKRNDVAVHGPDMVSDTYCVGCECGIGGPECATESEAVAAWNHRPAEWALIEALKAVRLDLIVDNEYPEDSSAVINIDAALKLAEEGRNG